MLWKLARCAMVACALGHVAPAAAADAGTPPRAATAAVLTALPAIEAPALSPDGRRVAARAMVDGRARLAIYDADHPARRPVPVALPEAERLEWHRWSDAGRLLVSLRGMGDSPRVRLVSVDVASGALTQIGESRDAAVGDTVIHFDPAGAFLLIQAQAPDQDWPAVYRIDLERGTTVRVVAPQPHVWDWYADAAGVVRAGLGEKGDRSWLLYRKGADDRFSRSTKGAGDPRARIDRFVPVRGSDEGFALAETRAGRTALFRYDFRKGRLGALVYEDTRADLEDFDIAPDGHLLSVEYSTERAQILWFDARLARRQAMIDAALPGAVNRVLPGGEDGSRLLVFSRTARSPGAYYLVEDGRATLLAAINPGLDGKRLSEVRPVRYAARDGLSIGGYLTLPVGREARDLPLIVLPHGGPYARDEWSYDPWIQYLAGKGYAVLQANYRGSTGFGHDLIAKGDGQWGRGMQDDLDDGVAWLAAQGIADPARVCIMGASYGGYAALWAAVRGGRAYRCAISFAGISDVAAQLDYDRETFSEADYRTWKRRIQGEAPSLDALSPIKRVRAMTIPMLIAHGGDDRVVPPAQSAALVAALRKLGRDPEQVVYAGEGHNLADPANSADFLERVGAFLDRHNPS